jgi:arsenate reductase (thioredoxin)
MGKNILILCTGNSCRSILAEAILLKRGAPRFRTFSAGSFPKGEVNPNAIALLKQLGYQTKDLRSKSWDEFTGPLAPKLDIVITVCGNAAAEQCPVWIGAPVQTHWGIDDPADIVGSQAEIDAAFKLAYDRLDHRITAFLALPIENMSAAQLKSALDQIGAQGI